MKKPKVWNKPNSRKLTPEAKAYLSFKLKNYYGTKRNKKHYAIEEMRKQPDGDDIVRISIKWRYPLAKAKHYKPLWIEAYIEGYYSDYGKLYDLLINTIGDNFGDRIAQQVEIGSEIIANRKIQFTIDREKPYIFFKREKNAKWTKI